MMMQHAAYLKAKWLNQKIELSRYHELNMKVKFVYWLISEILWQIYWWMISKIVKNRTKHNALNVKQTEEWDKNDNKYK